mgnify:CR=1 FL=1
MDIEIIKEESAPLLERKGVTFKVTFDKQATPAGKVLRAELAKKLKAKESLVAIRKVSQEFGANSATVTAYVYKKPEDMKLFEKKKAILEEAKAEEKKKEE